VSASGWATTTTTKKKKKKMFSIKRGSHLVLAGAFAAVAQENPEALALKSTLCHAGARQHPMVSAAIIAHRRLQSVRRRALARLGV